MNQGNIVQGNIVDPQNYMDEQILQNLMVNGNTDVPQLPNHMGNPAGNVVIGNNQEMDNVIVNNGNMPNYVNVPNNMNVNVPNNMNVPVNVNVPMNGNIEVISEMVDNVPVNLQNNQINDLVNGIEINNGTVMNNNMEMNNEKKLTTTTLNLTFYITYAFLMTTATITFIEAIRTKDLRIRNILNLETCISVVATFFYTQFVNKIKNSPDGTVDYREINMTRYTDWMITTPIMLLVLVLAINYNTGGVLKIGSYVLILIFNALMLGCGYFGERGKLDKKKANLMGFVFFIVLFGYIYMTFMNGKYNFDNNMIYIAFVVLWAIYGLVYNKEEEDEKNAMYNVLDLLSKCFVGIFFWAYFTKVFVLN
jgi:bacteriorhodopsin